MSLFSESVAIDQIRDGERIDASADAAECSAIAERLGLPKLERLDAHVALSRLEEGRIRASGRIKAVLEQSCVATGEPVPSHVDEAFDLLFIPEPASGPDEEIELSQDECDVVFHDGRTINLGDALADTLALSLDPYPRSAGAEAALKEAGVLSEEQAGPFAALAKLKGLGQNH